MADLSCVVCLHTGTSTTYPISFAEAAWAGQEFITNNPPVSAQVLYVSLGCRVAVETTSADTLKSIATPRHACGLMPWETS